MGAMKKRVSTMTPSRWLLVGTLLLVASLGLLLVVLLGGWIWP
jgi:hypothetical protein